MLELVLNPTVCRAGLFLMTPPVMLRLRDAQHERPLLVTDGSCVAAATGHVRHRRRGVPESAVRAEQRGRGQRGQHGPGG